MVDPSITAAAVLTPAGRGAIATLRVAGPEAIASVARFFAPATGSRLDETPLDQQLDRPRFGRWKDPAGEELIVVAHGATIVEIHCHGGTAAVAAILADLVSVGCQESDWRELAAAEDSDAIRRAAQEQLALASTTRTAGILLDQYSGALTSALRELGRALSRQDCAAAGALVDKLLQRAAIGRHLVAPFRVVLCGAPNVGKSSLINALMGFERSIVHERPGTTRDAVTAATSIDGWPVELVDTAGMHAADDVLERAGIARAEQQADAADLVLLVIDRSRGPTEADLRLFERWPRALIIENKSDLPAPPDSVLLAADCQTSAIGRAGIETLVDAISRRLAPEPPQPGDAVPFTDAQQASLQLIAEHVRQADLPAANGVVGALLAAPRASN